MLRGVAKVVSYLSRRNRDTLDCIVWSELRAPHFGRAVVNELGVFRVVLAFAAGTSRSSLGSSRRLGCSESSEQNGETEATYVRTVATI